MAEKRSRKKAMTYALFFGGFGAHKFYLGKPIEGLLYIVLMFTFIPLIISIIEFLILSGKSDEAFDLIYNKDSGPSDIDKLKSLCCSGYAKWRESGFGGGGK
jgi:TM2 domain-containing membrane protein YozV